MKAIERMNRQELQELVATAQTRLAELEAREAPTEARTREVSTGGPAATTRGRGHIEWKTINGCGPYAYLRYWEGGRLKSKYLGKNPVL